ncbi:MAG: LptF/LptG family permease [Puniceicoccales bacterium]|jgi:lipopolysaccharide export LptBFGC system permease protein LptF|nr:LptF/LptG family permease [Puniceicoccales bacterium]
MKLLHRYVLREWLLSLLCAHLVFVCLLLMEDAYKNLYFFVKAGASIRMLLEHYANLTVSFVPLAMHLAMFMASLFAFGKLHSSNEIVAMKCAGMNLLEIAKPVIACGVILASINLLFEAFVAPRASTQMTHFMARIKSKAGHVTKLTNVGFRNGYANRIWFFRCLDEFSNCAENVIVSCCGSDGGETERIFAKFAKFSDGDGCWHFSDGSVTIFDGNGRAASIARFAEKKLEAFSESPKIMAISAKKIKNLSLAEILGAIKLCGNGTVHNIFLARLHGMFAAAVRCALLLFFAIAFSTIGASGNTFANAAKATVVLLLLLAFESTVAVFGNGGVLPPPLAAWATTAVIFLPIAHLFRRAM